MFWKIAHVYVKNNMYRVIVRNLEERRHFRDLVLDGRLRVAEGLYWVLALRDIVGGKSGFLKNGEFINC
jgi:hypothetical protein